MTLSNEKQERLEAVKATFFVRRQEDSGLKPLEPEILKARCLSYERHLTKQGISPKDYDEIYEIAVEIYNDRGALGPFGIDFVVQAAKRFKERKEYEGEYTKLLKNKSDCQHCLGTSLEHTKNEEGKLENIVYETVNGKKIAKRCEYCYGQ